MRKKCIVCGDKLLNKPIYMCKKMPAISQNLPSKEELGDDKAMDLELCQCSGCGLVQFNCKPVEYYKDSTRAGERCEVLVQLRRKQYRDLIERFSLQGKKIVEIGAGKGGFLKTLKEMDCYDIKEYGIEYNAEYVRIANEDMGVNVQQGDAEDVSTVLDGAPFDAFVSFAYPARLVNPNNMLKLVHNNLKDGGVGLIQVPSLEHLLSKEGYFDITRDHIAYYGKDTLRFLLNKNGFDVLEIGDVSQIYIYAIVKKRQALDCNSVWKENNELIKEVEELIDESRCKKEKIAVWCAGHFAFTVLSMINASKDIEYIIDNAEFKQNRYAPSSHIIIKGPEWYMDHPVETIMILGPIYVDEIVKEIHEKCNGVKTIITVDKMGANVLWSKNESI